MARLAGGREKLRLGRVSRIRRVVVIRLVAANAGRRQRLVIVVNVAVQADSRRHGVRSGQRELRLIVIERGVGPRDRVMAKLARCREARMRHRARRVVEIVLVARNAERAVHVVVVIDVAVRTGARWHCMRSREREPGLRVVKLAIGPLNGVVTLLARRRESGVWYRTFRVVVVVLVT